MPRPKDENRSAEMYALYSQGFSLEEVGKAFGVSRQSVYGLLTSHGYKLREKKPLPFIVFSGAKYTLRNTGYYGKTDGGRTLLHRDVWEHHHGSIPDDCDIHHRDGDKTNNALENLECIRKSEHGRMHTPPQPLPEKNCLACGKPLERKQRPNGSIEGPAAFARRQCCGPACSGSLKSGKPHGWRFADG